jgi:hypothetical protein
MGMVQTSLGLPMAFRNGGWRRTPPSTPASYYTVVSRSSLESDSAWDNDAYTVHHEGDTADNLHEKIESTPSEFWEATHDKRYGTTFAWDVYIASSQLL